MGNFGNFRYCKNNINKFWNAYNHHFLHFKKSIFGESFVLKNRRPDIKSNSGGI